MILVHKNMCVYSYLSGNPIDILACIRDLVPIANTQSHSFNKCEQPVKEAGGLNFGLNLHLLLYLDYVSSEISGETLRMSSLVLAFDVVINFHLI